MSASLPLLFKTEQPWVIALVALYKRVTVSELLSLLLKKGNMSNSLVIWANRSKKNERFVCLFWAVFHWFSPFYAQEQITISLFHSQKRVIRSKKWKNQIPNSVFYDTVLYKPNIFLCFCLAAAFIMWKWFNTITL